MSLNAQQQQAIFQLYPQVVTVRSNQAFDAEGNKVQYDLAIINAYVASKAYIAQRQAEYPSIGDQLDALWKGGQAADDMLAQVQAVKAKYPKA